MTPFPQTLKRWRKTRRMSQLALAAEAEVSLRHLSFLETGRAQPSATMVGRLGEALDLPLSARNQMLNAAGFAARYPGRPWDSAEMAPIRDAVRYTLSAHAPYPALALDRMWRVMQMNTTATQLFGQVGVAQGDSLLDLMLSDHLPPLVENWAEVATHAAHRLRTESASQGGIAALDHAADVLMQVGPAPGPPPGPVVPTVLRLGEARLSMFATIAQFGTPEDLTLDDLKIEFYFPIDAATRTIFEAMGAPTPV